MIAQKAPKTLKWPSGCAHLLVHIRRPPIISPDTQAIGAQRDQAMSKNIIAVLEKSGAQSAVIVVGQQSFVREKLKGNN